MYLTVAGKPDLRIYGGFTLTSSVRARCGERVTGWSGALRPGQVTVSPRTNELSTSVAISGS